METLNPLNRSDLDTIEGWFNFAPVYDRIANAITDDDIFVEVGVWHGQSLIYFAGKCRELGKSPRIIGVDNFAGEQSEHYEGKPLGNDARATLDRNLVEFGVSEMVEIIQADSVKAAKGFKRGEIFACFIDSSHLAEDVYADVKAWGCKVKLGGFLGGHDWPAVEDAVKAALPSARAIDCFCWHDTEREI